MSANIVVDLGFGDSGKGITTDFIASRIKGRKKIMGVRTTGGPNAGHNVVIGKKQHVFSNFSSATFRGAGTYYGEYTCFNILNISIEKEILKGKMTETVPVICLHPLSKVITPYDVAFNQLTHSEINHGTTGKGIACTFSRNENTGYKLNAIDLTYFSLFLEKAYNIKKYYQKLADDMGRGLHFAKIYEKTEEDWLIRVKEWKHYVMVEDESFLTMFNELIFENTQGIMLDMDHGTFPNVTYSRTTSRNALEICESSYLGEEEPVIWYVTRCYQTRHGNGWMADEGGVDLSLPDNYLDTNSTNTHQGKFRVGELNYELLNYALGVDGIYAPNHLEKNIVVTCLDQRPGFKMEYDRFNMDFHSGWESYSPDNEFFKKVQLAKQAP